MPRRPLLCVRCTLVAAAEAVVLVAIDVAGLAVLLPGEDMAVLAGEAAVVLGSHVVLFTVDTAFLALEVGGFARGELAGADALRDAVLLVVLALVDGGAGLGKCRLRGRGRGMR